MDWQKTKRSGGLCGSLLHNYISNQSYELFNALVRISILEHLLRVDGCLCDLYVALLHAIRARCSKDMYGSTYYLRPPFPFLPPSDAELPPVVSSLDEDDPARNEATSKLGPPDPPPMMLFIGLLFWLSSNSFRISGSTVIHVISIIMRRHKYSREFVVC